MKKGFISITTLLIPVFACAAEPADSVSMLEEIVVTGSNKAVDARLMPYTVTVVTAKDLENSGQTQLLSVLSGQVPSLFVTQRGIPGFTVGSNGGAGHIKLRGIGGDRASAVLMMLDGQPQFAGIYSHHVADFYNKDVLKYFAARRRFFTARMLWQGQSTSLQNRQNPTAFMPPLLPNTVRTTLGRHR